MANILLDYFFKVTQIIPTAAASTAFLKQVCLVCAPATGQEGNVGTIYECTTNAQVAVRTDNTEAAQLFTAGMSKVFILLADDLNLAAALEGHESDFFTVLISSDFTDADVVATQASGNITITSYANLVSGTDDSVTINGVVFTAQAGAATLGTGTFQAATSNDATATSLAAQINAHADLDGVVTAEAAGAVVTIEAVVAGTEGNAITLVYTDNDTNVGATRSGATLTGGDGLDLGDFEGVCGVSSDDDAFLADQAAIANRCAFHRLEANAAKNMCYAFGKLLSNASSWKNQQFVTMPFADDIETLGAAEALFDDRISFVISDDEFGERLAFFCAGGKAITAPYIIKNIQIDLQSEALSYVSGNQPAYTKVQAALMEDELQKVIDGYIADQEIESGTVEVTLEEDNFVATGNIEVSEPRALWRIFAEMTQS